VVRVVVPTTRQVAPVAALTRMAVTNARLQHEIARRMAPNGDRFVYTHAAPGIPGTQLVLRRLDRPGTTVLFQGTSGSGFNADWR
jgi:hypothetical protein